jgi:glycosyltransferase involved in cell wall biosynthesis
MARRRLRVAFCLDSFAIGGTELNAVRTAEAFDPARIELFVTHLQTRGPLLSRYERLGVPMRHIPIPNLYSPRTARQGFALARQLRAWDVDVVHSHDIYCNIFAVPWARFTGRRAVIASRRWLYEAPRPELVRANRWCSRLAHRVLANSKGVAALLESEEGVPPSRIVVIPNFLCESAFEREDEGARTARRRAWGVPDGAFVVGLVARLSPVKNHGLLLQAAARLDGNFHFVLVGDGPSRAALEARAGELGIAERVHFVGEVVSPHNQHQYFDASVLCSTSEGFPNSLIEAMAAARPVVATPVGGVKDAVLEGVNGLLVPVEDPAPLAVALARLAEDPSLRTRIGEAGLATARGNFEKTRVIDTLCTLYEGLAGIAVLPRKEARHA